MPGRHDLVDPVQDRRVETDVGRRQLGLELLHGAGSDDGGADRRVLEHEGQGQLDHGEAGGIGHCGQLGDDLQLALVVRKAQVVAAGHPLGPSAGVVLAGPESSGQPAPGQRAPRDDAHPVGLGHGQNVGLDAPDQDGVRRLLGPEPLPAPALGHPLGLDDPLGRKGRAAERADLPGMDQVAEGTEGLVDVHRLVGPVDLVEVDVVGAQALEAVLALGDDPAPGVALGVGVVPHGGVDLGGQYHPGTVHRGQGLAHDDLGLARRVHVGGVDEVDAGVEGPVDDPDRIVVIGIAPRSEHHGPETEGADLDAGSTQCAHLHRADPTGGRGSGGGSGLRSRPNPATSPVDQTVIR